jgi:hypothetical protein
MNIPDGQMSEKERKYIYDLILKVGPKHVIESGTWKGGGSTLSIVKALHENQIGTLHTYEEYKEFYNIAKTFYENSQFINHIKLYNEDFVKAMEIIDDSIIKETEVVVLDGGDELPNGHHKLKIEDYFRDYNLSENVQSFKILENRLEINTHILLHDWSINIGRGHFVKRYLEETKNNNFYLHNLIEVEGSTGLAHLIKVR